MNTILRLPAVMARTGLSRSTLYLRISLGTFPKQVNLGARAVGWTLSSVDTWLAIQIERSALSQNNAVTRCQFYSEGAC